MKILFRNAKIIDKSSSFHNQIVDVKVVNGLIDNIGINLDRTSDFQEISLENLHLSQGWFDSSVCFGEPGFEDSETISNGLQVAAKSGFSAVALQPNTIPVVDNQAMIQFVKSKAIGYATDLYPIGAFTKKSEGKDLAEMFDMKNAGAIAFGDYAKSISNSNLLKIGLQYVQDFDGLLLAFCQDENIAANGIANESEATMHLGLKGIPNLAEELQVARNVFLLEYAGGKLHFPTLSTAKSVDLIREAKAKGLNVSCSVSVHHLTLTDSELSNFDTRYKVSPPLRTEKDRLALVDAVLDGTIDMITCDHSPIDIEHKKMEFDLAKNGTIGLESAFGMLMNVLPLNVIVEKLTDSKKMFNIENSKIEIGQIANFTLFNPNDNSVFTKENILSKSKNSAFLGKVIVGQVYGIFNNNQLVLNKLKF